MLIHISKIMDDKKYFFGEQEYVGSKTALIKAIRKRKPYPVKELQAMTRQQLFRIFNKI